MPSIHLVECFFFYSLVLIPRSINHTAKFNFGAFYASSSQVIFEGQTNSHYELWFSNCFVFTNSVYLFFTLRNVDIFAPTFFFCFLQTNRFFLYEHNFFKMQTHSFRFEKLFFFLVSHSDRVNVLLTITCIKTSTLFKILRAGRTG